jgi:hypothetical protein
MATAAAQPPGGANQPQPKRAEKKPDPADSAIAAALANDPDVKMAQAKMQLAEAELAKSRHAVTIKVVTLKAKIEQLKAQLVPLERQVELVTRSVKSGGASVAELYPIAEKLEAAMSSLALAETDWKLRTGGAGAGPLGAVPNPDHDAAVAAGLRWLNNRQQGASHADASAALLGYLVASELVRERAAVKGLIPSRIRAALDKPVKLGAKGEKVTFAQAVAAFKKEAGMDVPVREVARVSGITSEGEELPVGAWFQLFADRNLDVRFLVREYGLLVTLKAEAPPDAVGVVEFWKHKPPAKETSPEPKK